MLRITGGRLRGRRIAAPSSPAVRPTAEKVRQAVFDILGPRVDGARVLDGFAGSGALGVEALSRGAASAVFVEHGRASLRALRDNLTALELESVSEVLALDWSRAVVTLARRAVHYDVVLLDPPYDSDPGPVLLGCLESGLLATDGLLVMEVASRTKLTPQVESRVERRRYGDTTLLLADGL